MFVVIPAESFITTRPLVLFTTFAVIFLAVVILDPSAPVARFNVASAFNVASTFAFAVIVVFFAIIVIRIASLVVPSTVRSDFATTLILAPVDCFATVRDNFLSDIRISFFLPLSTNAFTSLIATDFRPALLVTVAFFASIVIETLFACFNAGIVSFTFFGVLIWISFLPLFRACFNCFWFVTTLAFLLAASEVTGMMLAIITKAKRHANTLFTCFLIIIQLLCRPI